jgi:hypothetical protein
MMPAEYGRQFTAEVLQSPTTFKFVPATLAIFAPFWFPCSSQFGGDLLEISSENTNKGCAA